jgi:Cu-Zn family superoxide dismutase
MCHFFPILLTLMLWPMLSSADETTAEIHAIDEKGVGASLGRITIKEIPEGIRLSPDLHGLPPGQHGFHLHENASCEPGEKDGKVQAGLKAGSHHDPDKTGKHLGPDSQGHKGDLPMLAVSSEGLATTAVTSSRLRANDLKGRSLVIHATPDNYGDQPGGARIACGIIQ